MKFSDYSTFRHHYYPPTPRVFRFIPKPGNLEITIILGIPGLGVPPSNLGAGQAFLS